MLADKKDNVLQRERGIMITRKISRFNAGKGAWCRLSYKRCENCNQVSYSAHDRGIWYCPYCGKDLTFTGLITDVYQERAERVIDEKREGRRGLYVVK